MAPTPAGVTPRVGFFSRDEDEVAWAYAEEMV